VAIETERIAALPRDHVVQFYERDDELVNSAGAYLIDALKAGEVVVTVTTTAHRAAFEAAMGEAGIDVGAALAAGDYIALDALDTLSHFLVDHRPDPAAFNAVVGGVIEDAAQGGRPVRAYGEMVALLWEEGHVTAAVELEALWNDLGRQLPFSLYCSYRVEAATGDGQSLAAFNEVCRLHSAVVGDDTRSFAATLDAPRAARLFVVSTLARWGEHALIDDAAIIITELATNAILHGHSGFTVSVSSRWDALRVAVRDTSTAAPARREAPPLATSGRGLELVTALATRWGAELVPDGKLVWADLRRP
jgi:anti-sigma regulatory factor (Ser/Thr protein kinase)